MRVISVLCILIFVVSAFAAETERINYIEKISLNDCPSISLEQLYRSLSYEEKVFMVKMLQKMASSQLPPNLFETAAQLGSITGGGQYGDYIKKLVAFVNADDPAQAIAVLDSLDKDRLLMVKPAMFRLFHQYIAQQLRGTLDEVERTPAYLKDDFKKVDRLQFYSANDFYDKWSVPKTHYVEKFKQGGKSFGKYETVARLPENTIINSMNLAACLNQLSNAGTSSEAYGTVRVVLSPREQFTARRPEDIMTFIAKNPDFELRAYEAKVSVDYAGMYVKNFNNYIAIEIPSLTITEVRNKNIAMPGNHSEHLVAVYKKGEKVPMALVKWYMGLPSDNALHQGTIWKPAIYSRSKWTGFRITHEYTNAANIEKLTQGAMYFMKFFNYLVDKFKFPNNGYGVIAVCNDSTSLLETLLGNDPRLTAWPNMRAVAYDSYYNKVFHRFGGNLKLENGYLNVVADVYPDVYYRFKNDTEIAKRLALNVPFRKPDLVQGVVYKENLRELMWMFSSFAKDMNVIIED